MKFHHSDISKTLCGLSLMLFIRLFTSQAIMADEAKCNYDRTNPSIENARMSILASKFHCAIMEIEDFLKDRPEDDRSEADAYVILALAEYGLEKDSAIIIDYFYKAFRANPGWDGELHFNHPRLKRYMKIGRDRAARYFGETSFLVFTGGGGASFTSSPVFRDRWKRGSHGLIGAGMRISRFIEILAKAEVHRFQVKRQIPVYDSIYEAISGEYRAILLGVDSRVNLFMLNFRTGSRDSDSPFRFYLIFGLGAAVTDVSEIVLAGAEPVEGSDDTDIYFNFGISAEFKIYKRLRIFAQGRYVRIASPDNDLFAPVSAGFRL